VKLIEKNPVVVLSSSITASSGVGTVLADATVTTAHGSSSSAVL